jgi:NAD(P)-dependent dehydrogenase (short-subunit alcohol dehydrogenase family)
MLLRPPLRPWHTSTGSKTSRTRSGTKNRRDEVDLVFYLTRAAWPHLKASRGVVVNTASLNALLSFKTLGSLAHTTAKAGIIAMTRQLAMEGREHGIRANSISPGLIETKGRVYGPSGAAARLGIPRSTLEWKIRALKIDKNRFRTLATKSS